MVVQLAVHRLMPGLGRLLLYLDGNYRPTADVDGDSKADRCFRNAHVSNSTTNPISTALIPREQSRGLAGHGS